MGSSTEAATPSALPTSFRLNTSVEDAGEVEWSLLEAAENKQLDRVGEEAGGKEALILKYVLRSVEYHTKRARALLLGAADQLPRFSGRVKGTALRLALSQFIPEQISKLEAQASAIERLKGDIAEIQKEEAKAAKRKRKVARTLKIEKLATVNPTYWATAGYGKNDQIYAGQLRLVECQMLRVRKDRSTRAAVLNCLTGEGAPCRSFICPRCRALALLRIAQRLDIGVATSRIYTSTTRIKISPAASQRATAEAEGKLLRRMREEHRRRPFTVGIYVVDRTTEQYPALRLTRISFEHIEDGPKWEAQQYTSASELIQQLFQFPADFVSSVAAEEKVASIAFCRLYVREAGSRSSLLGGEQNRRRYRL